MQPLPRRSAARHVVAPLIRLLLQHDTRFFLAEALNSTTYNPAVGGRTTINFVTTPVRRSPGDPRGLLGNQQGLLGSGKVSWGAERLLWGAGQTTIATNNSNKQLRNKYAGGAEGGGHQSQQRGFNSVCRNVPVSVSERGVPVRQQAVPHSQRLAGGIRYLRPAVQLLRPPAPPRVVSCDSRALSRESCAPSCDPRVLSRASFMLSRDPRVLSRDPRVLSCDPRALTRLPFDVT